MLLLEILLLFLRVGVDVTLAEVTRVKLRIGPLRLQLLPKKEKKKAKEKKTAEKPKEKKAKPAKPKPKIGFSEVRSGAETLLPALKTALRKTRRSVRIHPLNLHVIFGGYDPASVAQTYGWAQAVMWSVMPEAERLLVIPKPHIRLDTDFNAVHTLVRGEFGLSARIGDLLNILMTLLVPAAKWYKSLPRPVAEPAAAAQGAAGETPDVPLGETPAGQAEQTTDKPQSAAEINTEQEGASYGNDETRSQ